MSGPKLVLKRTTKWEPNGPLDYARTIRKYNIGPSGGNLIYARENKLYRLYPKEGHHHGVKSFLKGGSGVLYKALGNELRQIPTSLAKAITSNDDGEAELESDATQEDAEYITTVEIGTPAQSIHLDFDTGSSDLWVLTNSIKLTSAQKKEFTVYNPTASTTSSTISGQKFKISYGDGSSASGGVHSDVLALGSLVIQNQAIETATQASSSFLQPSTPSSSGLLGLAFPNLNSVTPTPQKTPVENLIDQNLLDQPLFTAKLDKSPATSTGSFYTFGYIDTSVELTTPFSYVPVNGEGTTRTGYWEFPTTSMTVGGETITLSTSGIADTGTTLILLDDATVTSIFAKIPGATNSKTVGGWVIPKDATIPDIGFGIGENTYTIPGNDLLFADNGDDTYYSAIQSRGDSTVSILGDVFLKRVYTVFNQGENTIGFAQRASY